MRIVFALFSILLLAAHTYSFPYEKDVGSVTYVHDWKTIDLAGLPLIKNGNTAIGKLLLETQADRILYIQIENPQNLDDFGTIFVQDSTDTVPTLLKETKFYSKTNSLKIQFVPSKLGTDLSLRLKIGKATGCPLNIGANTQCGRIVDDVSCYCINYNKQEFAAHQADCRSQGFPGLVSVETMNEDQALFASWGAYQDIYTSLTDNACVNNWIWETTGQPLGAYTNWCIGKPNLNTGERCMKHWSANAFCWSNASCNEQISAVCEIQP